MSIATRPLAWQTELRTASRPAMCFFGRSTGALHAPLPRMARIYASLSGFHVRSGCCGESQATTMHSLPIFSAKEWPSESTRGACDETGRTVSAEQILHSNNDNDGNCDCQPSSARHASDCTDDGAAAFRGSPLAGFMRFTDPVSFDSLQQYSFLQKPGFPQC